MSVLHNSEKFAIVADKRNQRKVVMDTGVQDLFQRLIHQVLDKAHSAPDNSELRQFLNGMLEPGNTSFAGEPIHELKPQLDKNPALPTELLLRVGNMGGKFMEKALAQLNDLGDLEAINKFDTAVALAAVDHAVQRKLFPVSINVSSRNIESPRFWVELDQLLTSHFYTSGCCKPSQITFELLEDKKEYFDSYIQYRDESLSEYRIDSAYQDNLDFMMEFKKRRGYRFSMDDLTDQKHDTSRFLLYRDLVDNVKLDWQTTKKTLAGESDKECLSWWTTYCEKNEKNIIFEGVQNADEANYAMTQHQAAGAQGRELDENRTSFNKAFNVACLAFKSNAMNSPESRKPVKPLLLKTTSFPALTMA